MGKYDSSLTRVQPVFEMLLKRDPSGKSWLPTLMNLAEQSSDHDHNLGSQIGNIIPKKRFFEVPIPPPVKFLAWLVKNPNKLKWPLQRGRKKEFGHTTQKWREKLFGLHGKKRQNLAIQEAVRNIEIKGAVNSRRKWWAFEGLQRWIAALKLINYSCLSRENAKTPLRGQLSGMMGETSFQEIWKRAKNWPAKKHMA